MLERKDYPVFSYFMETYMSDFYYAYTENAYFFREAAAKEKCMKLKAEILELKGKEPWEVQAFMKQWVIVKQKNVSAVLDTIFNALGNKKSCGGKKYANKHSYRRSRRRGKKHHSKSRRKGVRVHLR